MKRLLFFLLLLWAAAGNAQRAKLDSLLAVANANPHSDSLKLVQLTNVFRQYARMSNFTQVEAWGARAVELAKTLPGHLPLFNTYRRLALCYHGAAVYLPAVKHYEKAAAVAAQHNEKRSLAGIYLNLSALYSSVTDYAKALEASQRAVNLYNELGDANNVSSCYMNIGIVYADMRQQGPAINYKKKALAIFKTQNEGLHYGGAVGYSSLASSISLASDEELRQNGIAPADRDSLSLEYLQQALYISEHAESAAAMQPEVHMSIGRWYEQHGDATAANRSYTTALKFARGAGESADLSNALLFYGSFLLAQGRLNEAEDALRESLALSRSSGVLGNQADALGYLSTLYEKRSRPDSALALYRRHIGVKDAILDTEKEKDITRRQLKLDFSIKEHEYQLQQQLVDGKLQQQLLLAEQRRQQLLVERQKVELIGKEKDLQRLNYLQHQQALQAAKDRQQADLDRHILQARVDKADSERKITNQNMELAADKKMQAFFLVALLLLSGLAGFILYDRWKTKKLNRIIQAQKEELQQLSLVKDRIFGVVSHDMRAPVSSLVSFITLLESGDLKQGKLTLYARELKSTLDHTSVLMNNLLLWAASQMKGFRVQAEPVRLQEVLDEVGKSVHHHLVQKDVRIEADIPAALQLHTDRNMLGVVLRNLVSNAVKFSHKGGVVRVRAAEGGIGVILEVADDGVGISPELAARFNSSYTGMNDSRRGTANEKGTGLGLLLCKTLVQQMGGTISVTGSASGTRFRVLLPDAPASA